MAEEQNTNECTEESCAGCAHADTCSSKKTDFREPANMYSSIKKVIGVVSGKGGVGKSLVTASLARMMREKGYIWYFPNPVNSDENLAIRWHENNNKQARNFFDFVMHLRSYSIKLREAKGLQEIAQILSLMLGDRIGESVFKRIGKQYGLANSAGTIGIDSKTKCISTDSSSDGFRCVKKNTFYGERK